MEKISARYGNKGALANNKQPLAEAACRVATFKYPSWDTTAVVVIPISTEVQFHQIGLSVAIPATGMVALLACGYLQRVLHVCDLSKYPGSVYAPLFLFLWKSFFVCVCALVDSEGSVMVYVYIYSRAYKHWNVERCACSVLWEVHSLSDSGKYGMVTA